MPCEDVAWAWRIEGWCYCLRLDSGTLSCVVVAAVLTYHKKKMAVTNEMKSHFHQPSHENGLYAEVTYSHCPPLDASVACRRPGGRVANVVADAAEDVTYDVPNAAGARNDDDEDDEDEDDVPCDDDTWMPLAVHSQSDDAWNANYSARRA
mmetsp:Transcript_4870/g.10689  ORF Transcript_4870/g.10689 Transcript_4870/m.10689 type:complete len:151 (-) Transcript_4870:582-1034(-)